MPTIVVICFQNCIFDISETTRYTYHVVYQRIKSLIRKEKIIVFRFLNPAYGGIHFSKKVPTADHQKVEHVFFFQNKVP